jgi:hypothetical protein
MCRVEGLDGKSLELSLDLRRLLRKARLKRLALVCDPELELESESESLEELELSEELEECSISARTPGCDSSSIKC